MSTSPSQTNSTSASHLWQQPARAVRPTSVTWHQLASTCVRWRQWVEAWSKISSPISFPLLQRLKFSSWNSTQKTFIIHSQTASDLYHEDLVRIMGCIRMCAHVFECEYMCACRYVCVCVCACVCKCECVCAYMSVCMCMNVDMSVCVCVCMQVASAHICMFVYVNYIYNMRTSVWLWVCVSVYACGWV